MSAGNWLKEHIEARRDEYCKLSDAIWEHPEIGFQEYYAIELLQNALEKSGFTVEDGLAGIPTAFRGTYGSGSPVIGFVAEFDALAGMSQKEDCLEETPVCSGGPGHGCGHNLLAVSPLAAAVAAKDYLEVNGLSGTVIYFGCPAEESGCGKSFMTREGVFKNVDVVLTWHPGDGNAVVGVSNLASVQVKYHFKGKPAHAASSPHKGRSALDAAELMNMGVQFLREHIPSDMRIHYSFLDAGGEAPNIVQSHATLLYSIRGPKAEQALEAVEWVADIAKGAALMTHTAVEIESVSGLLEYIPNKVLGEVVHDAWKEVGEIAYSPAAEAANRRYSQIVEPVDAEKPMLRAIPPEYTHTPEVHKPVSNDLGDISYVVPTGKIQVACYTKGTPGHSWQMVTQGRSEMAHDGMIHAGKVLAAAAVRLYENPSLVQLANEELVGVTGRKYPCLLPADKQPDCQKQPD